MPSILIDRIKNRNSRFFQSLHLPDILSIQIHASLFLLMGASLLSLLPTKKDAYLYGFEILGAPNRKS